MMTQQQVKRGRGEGASLGGLVWFGGTWCGQAISTKGCLDECRSTFQPDMLDVLTSHRDPRFLWPGFLKPTSAFLCTYRLDTLLPKQAWAEPL